MLKLIKSTPKSELYGRAYMRKLEKWVKEGGAKKSNPTLLMSTVFLGTKTIISSGGKDRPKDLESLMDRFEHAEALRLLMSRLTPVQFMNTFPIDKTYDGDRYECKDYFYTIEKARALDQDSPIGDKIEDFLWDYMNMNTRLFQVEMLGLASDIAVAMGEPSFMERISAEEGTPLYYMDEKKKEITGPVKIEKVGDDYYVDRAEAKTVPLKKPMPDYLKIVAKEGATDGNSPRLN